MSSPLLFSTFEVSRQAFYRTATTAAIVNLKPIVPGHVLVIPTRVVPRISDLTTAEISSLFSSVQVVGRLVQKAYKADGLTIACQDGKAAGQSVPHVHVHVLPRRYFGDRFADKGDEIYPELEAHDEKLGESMRLKSDSTTSSSTSASPQARGSSDPSPGSDRSLFRVDNESRKPRSIEDMEQEANWLKELIDGSITNEQVQE